MVEVQLRGGLSYFISEKYCRLYYKINDIDALQVHGQYRMSRLGRLISAIFSQFVFPP